MSREEVLARIRRSLDPKRVADITRRTAAEERLKDPARHPIPARARQPEAALRLLFESELRRQSASIIAVTGAQNVPAAVAAYLKEHGVPLRLRCGDDAPLAKLPWAKVPVLTVSRGPAAPDDVAALSRAVAGVAETGTLVLASSAGNPASLALLPETHLVVLPETAIVGPFEDAIDGVRAAQGANAMPRSLNFISGPSRTGDIGGRLVLGAHGPRRLAVLIVKGAG